MLPIFPKIDFEVLLDDSLDRVRSLPQEMQGANQNLLSLVNDYEEGEWRYDKFSGFVWDNIAESALSFDEREKLATRASSQLKKAAQNLRLSDDTGKGSELAEIFLYGIMKHHYGAVSAVPKIFYKQNTQDYAKGADSVHIVLEENKKFSIWLGEAKFYENVVPAMSDAIQSIKKILKKNKLKKETSIITGLQELDKAIEDTTVVGNIKALLSNDTSIDKLKPVLHMPILLLYQCEITRQETQFTDEYREGIKNSHRKQASVFFKNHADELADSVHLYSQISFHLILFPVPDAKKIKDEFVNTAVFFRKI